MPSLRALQSGGDSGAKWAEGETSMIMRFFITLCCICLFFACSPSKQIRKTLSDSTLFDSAFTGYEFVDLSSGKVLASQHADKYFRPGSNTKILTLYASLALLPDSLAAFQSQKINDTTRLWRPLADPTTGHPRFEAWQSRHQPYYIFPTETKVKNIFVTDHWQETAFGNGWMWDDFGLAFCPQRSALTYHGNVVEVGCDTKSKSWTFTPLLHGFDIVYQPTAKEPKRAHLSKTLTLPTHCSTDSLTYRFPMHEPQQLAVKQLGFLEQGTALWANALKTETHFSVPKDTVLRLMMQQSDNLLAEQLLLQCGFTQTGTLQTKSTIEWVLKNKPINTPTQPKWVDGSGLSHYNLITPQSLIAVLTDLWRQYDHTRITSIFPAGGVSGSIKSWYAGKNGVPYVFAKTGTVSNCHTLSGYLLTRSGRWVAFSMMHNNYLQPTNTYRAEMQKVLEAVRDGY
jgi:serine-type D-Ala-D-Ala carboxypeptidase/endopeptidase (penicillin-binding protein 4)